MNKKWKILLIVSCFLGIVIVGTTVYFYQLFQKAYQGDVKSFSFLVKSGFKKFPKIDVYESVYFSNDDLKHIHFEESKFYCLVAIECDMSYANFKNADIAGSNLRSSRLNKANFNNAKMEHIGLAETHLRYAQLKNADLYGAIFDSADLRSADLSQTDLRDASFENTNFGNANLREADLLGCENITPKQLSLCKDITDIRGLSQKFLREVETLNPKLMEWWDGSPRDMDMKDWVRLVKKRNYRLR